MNILPYDILYRCKAVLETYITTMVVHVRVQESYSFSFSLQMHGNQSLWLITITHAHVSVPCRELMVDPKSTYGAEFTTMFATGKKLAGTEWIQLF